MGGAHAIAALAYGTETIAPRRRDRRARATSGSRRPSARSPATSASTASPGPSDVLRARRRGRRRRADRARPARPGRARRRARSSSPVSDDARAARRRRRAARGRRRRRARSRSSTSPDLEAALALRRGARARAPRAVGAGRRGAGAARAPRGLPVRRRGGATAFGDYVAGSNHTLPTGGAARFASGLAPRHFRRRMSEVRDRRRGGALARPRARRSRAPRASTCTQRRWRFGRIRAHEPHAQRSPATTAETEVRLALASTAPAPATRATGVGFLDHMLDLLARHGRLDLDVGVTGDLETGAHHTVEDTGLALGQALDEALGDRAGITRYGHAVVPMDEARAIVRDRRLGPAAAGLRGRAAAAAATGGMDHELVEEFFRALASTREADAAHRGPARAPTPTT